jgi:hypothetical protein
MQVFIVLSAHHKKVIRVHLPFSPVLWWPLGMQDALHLGPILEHAGKISELQYMLLDHSTHQPNSPSNAFKETNPTIYISYIIYNHSTQEMIHSLMFSTELLLILLTPTN